MELELIERIEFESNFSSGYDFIEKNKGIAIPYLSLISLFTCTGTIGNILVLGSLIITQVN